MKKKLIICGVVLGLVLMSVIVAYTQRERAQNYLVNYVTEQIQFYTGCRVEFDDINFTYPLHLEVGHLTICEGKQPLVKIERFKVSVALFELFRKKLVFKELKAHSLSLVAVSQGPSADISLDSLPKFIKIEKLEIERLSIDEKIMTDWGQQDFAYLFKSENPLHIKGKGILEPFHRSLFIDLEFHEAERSPTSHIVASLNIANGQIKTHFRVAESNNGLIARHLGLPEGYSYQSIFENRRNSPHNFLW